MLHLKAFVKKTAGGQVHRVVKEHYVRDDIESGSELDPLCKPENAKLSAAADHYLIVDTNVVLHQTDFLEHASITDVVILGTVYQEVHHKNSSVFLRLKNLLRSEAKRFYYFSNEHHKETYVVQDKVETPNDRNDRAIRISAQWYMQRVPGKEIILLTGDADNRRKAASMGVKALTADAYATEKAVDSSVLDLIVAGSETRGHASGGGGGGHKRQKVFQEHLTYTAVHNGIKAGRLFQGTLNVNRYNPFEGWVTRFSEDQNVLIKGKMAMNRAFNGDTVVVELLPESQWEAPSSKLPGQAKGKSQDEVGAAEATIAQELDAPPPASGRTPCGVVVSITKRSWRARGYAGSLKEDTIAAPGRTASVIFVPLERSVPYIRMQTRQAAQLMDKRLVVVVDEWPVDSAYPLGHYIRTLGRIGDVDTESDALLLEYDVNTAPFTPAVHACVPPLPWTVTDADVTAPWRRDLRHICVCSVDPPGCKDIDDALHARQLPNGNIELGVHIADVTHFVRPGTPIDEEAARRSTTVYLVNRRIDMLPKPLTEDICSLRADVDRLAFSVLWEMTPDAEVVSTAFTKSIIRSSAALTYEQAQNRINDSARNDTITLSLRELLRVSRILRKRRYEAGALSLASPEVKFKLDTETHNPTDVGMYELRETNSMVEEMMLLANITVATHIHRAFPACAVLRRHEAPTPAMFKPLLQAVHAWGMDMNVESSKRLAESLDAAALAEDPYFNQIVRIMATRCMTQAKYFSSGTVSPAAFRHYGLAAPIYTHFTSPIRRYADVLVHRCLSAALGLTALPDGLKDHEYMEEIVTNMNERHINAARASRSSAQLHTLIFFRDRAGLVADARVLKVQANGLIVLVPRFGIEGPVFFGDGDDAPTGITLNEANQEVVLANGTKYKVFSPCAVRMMIEKGANHREKLKIELVDRAQLEQSEEVARK
eukprot:jgi/Ulvmu1/533/UM001_0541.1